MPADEVKESTGERQNKINLTYELFILFLSLYAIVVIILVQIVPISDSTIRILIIVDNFVAVVFLYDFFRQLYMAPRKLNYLKWGWMDLLSGLPGMYYLRLLRIGRIIRTRNELRRTTGRSTWEAFKHHRAESAVLTTTFGLFFLILFASILILNAEADSQNAVITDAEDAVWWSFVTLTTVGYGDEIPSTGAGRLIGIFLMTGGILLAAVFTGYAASYFNPRSEREMEMLIDVRSELEEIKRLLVEKSEKEKQQGNED